VDEDGRPLPPDPATVGRVLRIEEVPLVDVTDRDRPAQRAGASRPVTAAGLTTVARDAIERIAVTRSLAVLAWQLMSVLVLAAMFVWIAWFPFAATGTDARALVVSDSRMAPTILRGDVVVVRDSPDLPYPLDTVVAIEQGGVLLTERIVGEDLTGTERILLTRSDGVSIGADRRVRTDEVIGSVRRIHRLVGYPVLWFTQPGAIVQQLLVVLLVLSSAVGAVSLVVRWDLKRSDRALVSAIASGARTPQ
jgi:signal peptidase I